VDTVVIPDISVICDKDKLDNKGCNGAPDFIVEIVSASNSAHDYVKKLNLYLDYGVHEYWIVNPINRTVLIYFFEKEITPFRYDFEDTIKVNIYEDLYLCLKDIN
jgi:Uma2 family endonuclease